MSTNLLESLADLWQVQDPVPVDLVDRVLAALAISDVDVEYELLALTAHTVGLVGARGGDETLTFTFEAADLSMVLRVSPTGPDTCRVDGWISPPREMSVTATQSGVNTLAHAVDPGRFEFPHLKAGATRFLLHPEANSTHRVTPSVEL